MVTVLGVLGALVLLMGTAFVATRSDGAVLQPAERDRADTGLPESGLLADDLRRVRFGMVLRGYRMDEVDAVLDRAAEQLAREQQRVRDLEAQLGDRARSAAAEQQ